VKWALQAASRLSAIVRGGMAQEKSPADIVCIEAAVYLEYETLAEIALENVAVVADGS